MTDTGPLSRERIAIREMANTLCALGRRVKVCFSVDDTMTAAIASMPGAKSRTTVYSGGNFIESGPYAIDFAEVELRGVSFDAQSTGRAATAEELADLSSERARDLPRSPCKAVTR